VRAILREIRDSMQADSWHGSLIGLELRIEQGGELRESQLLRDRQAGSVRTGSLRRNHTGP
jgi:hypothetical protein